MCAYCARTGACAAYMRFTRTSQPLCRVQLVGVVKQLRKRAALSAIAADQQQHLELPRLGNGQAWRCGQYIATAHRRPGRSVRGAAVRHRPGSRRAAGAGTRQHHMCVRCPVHPPSVRHRARHRCVRRLSRQSGSCGFAESRAAGFCWAILALLGSDAMRGPW